MEGIKFYRFRTSIGRSDFGHEVFQPIVCFQAPILGNEKAALIGLHNMSEINSNFSSFEIHWALSQLNSTMEILCPGPLTRQILLQF